MQTIWKCDIINLTIEIILRWRKFIFKENENSMNGIGVIVNVLSALVGGGFGLMFRGKIKASYQQLLYRLVGLAILGVGAYEFMQHFFVFDGKETELTGSMLVIVALLLGGVMGYLFNIHYGLMYISKRLATREAKDREKEKVRLDRLSRAVDASLEQGLTPPKVSLLDRLPTYEMPSQLTGNIYADGFIPAVVLLCANSMLFNGVMADGMSGETGTLFVKSAIDFVLCFTLAMTCGMGPLYATIPMMISEGLIWAMCMLLPDLTVQFFTPSLNAQISVIGAVLLLVMGIQIAFDRKKLRAENLLPAYLIPIIYYGILFVVDLFLEK